MVISVLPSLMCLPTAVASLASRRDAPDARDARHARGGGQRARASEGMQGRASGASCMQEARDARGGCGGLHCKQCTGRGPHAKQLPPSHRTPNSLNGLWGPVPILTNPLVGLASQVFGVSPDEWPVNVNGGRFKTGRATW